MTLIALVLKEHDYPVAIGDLAISSETGEPVSVNQLPFQATKGPANYGAEKFSTANIVSLSQKVIRFGPHLVLWAGKYLYAKVAIRALFEQRSILSTSNIESILQSAVGEGLHDLEIIYCYGDPPCLDAWHHNCSVTHSNGSSIIAGGSGAYRFLSEFTSESAHILPEMTSNFRQVAVRLTHLIDAELSDANAYWYGVGGGYEVVSIKEDGWSTLPYCITFAVGNTHGFGIQRLMTYSYYGNHLCIDLYRTRSQCVLLGDAKGQWPYLFETEIDRIDRFIVGDFLARDEDLLGFPIGQVDFKDERVRLEPDFNLVKVHKVNDQNTGPSSWWTYTPAVCGAIINDKGRAISARAFFLREVEEWYVGRNFVAPDEYVDFYRDTRAAWKAGQGLRFRE